MSSAAQAYARVANTTSSPRDIEAQALLTRGEQVAGRHEQCGRDLYAEVRSADIQPQALDDLSQRSAARKNPKPLEVRQNIANIGIFVLSQTAALQISPQLEHIKPLIEINRNIAAGLSGRG